MTTANSSPDKHIAAIVLAAGLSRRMGRPKLVLPWYGTTVIESVVNKLTQADLQEIIVVTGASHQQVSQVLAETNVKLVFNPSYRQDSMLISLKCSLDVVSDQAEAILVVLGDQPQIETDVVSSVIAEYLASGAELVVPSYRMRRGHPWLAARSFWPQIWQTAANTTLRDLLNQNAEKIAYVNVETESILKDLDTPEDYAAAS